MSPRLLFFFFSALFLIHVVRGEEAARLVVRKECTSDTALGNILVQDMNITVDFLIINVGDSPARNVRIMEERFGDELELVDGKTEFESDVIDSGENATFSYVMRPIAAGSVEIKPATVTYIDYKTHEQIGYSSPIGTVSVLERDVYLRVIDKHLKEWGVFALAAVVATGLPGLVFLLIRLQYSGGISKKYLAEPKKKKSQ